MSEIGKFARTQELPAESRLAKPWLNPLSLLDLRKAIEKRKTTVVLDGRKFSIKYEDNEKVWIQYTQAMAPCGRFPISDIMTPDKIFVGV